MAKIFSGMVQWPPEREAERIVYRACHDQLAPDYTVFYSAKWQWPDRHSRVPRDGAADFVWPIKWIGPASRPGSLGSLPTTRAARRSNPRRPAPWSLSYSGCSAKPSSSDLRSGVKPPRKHSNCSP